MSEQEDAPGQTKSPAQQYMGAITQQKNLLMADVFDYTMYFQHFGI